MNTSSHPQQSYSSTTPFFLFLRKSIWVFCSLDFGSVYPKQRSGTRSSRRTIQSYWQYYYQDGTSVEGTMWRSNNARSTLLCDMLREPSIGISLSFECPELQAPLRSWQLPKAEEPIINLREKERAIVKMHNQWYSCHTTTTRLIVLNCV